MERAAKKSTVRSSKDRRARRRSRKNNQERVTNWSVARSVTNSRWPQGRERNEGGNKGSEKSGRCSAIVRVETSSEVGGAPRKLATEKDNKEGMVQCVSELSEASRGEQRPGHGCAADSNTKKVVACFHLQVVGTLGEYASVS